MFIAFSLSLMVMAAVLASYIFVARSYTRTVGFGSPNSPTLEAQGRQTLAYFSQDVQSASAILIYPTNLPTAYLTLTVPLSTGGTKTIIYYYNSTAAPFTLLSLYSVPALSLARIDVKTGAILKLHSSLLTCAFTYYDNSGNPYTSYTNYLIGIKQISLALTAQAGTAASGTLTQLYRVNSPRLLVRNFSPLL